MQLTTISRVLDGEIMTASKLTLRSIPTSTNESRPAAPGNQVLLRRIGLEPRNERCPACNSIIYSRRHDRCGVCERFLPKSYLLNCAEAERVNLLLKTERERHRAWLMKSENGQP